MPDIFCCPVLHVPSTLGDVISLYLTHTRAEQHPRTYADRVALLQEFSATHGRLGLREARPFHLSLWIDGQANRWKSDWTRLRVASTVKGAFGWARRMGVIDHHPFAGVSYPVGESGQPMSDTQYRSLLRATSAMFRRVLVFLRFTGCRPGEMAALRPSDVDLDRGVALLHCHKTRRKTRRPRVIVLHPVAAKLLRWQLARMVPGQGHLFLSARGNPWHRSSLALRIGRLRAKCGIPPTCKLYGLRHAYGTQAVLAGVPIKLVSVLMGHANVRTTEHYTHIAGEVEQLRQAAERIFRM